MQYAVWNVDKNVHENVIIWSFQSSMKCYCTCFSDRVLGERAEIHPNLVWASPTLGFTCCSNPMQGTGPREKAD